MKAIAISMAMILVVCIGLVSMGQLPPLVTQPIDTHELQMQRFDREHKRILGIENINEQFVAQQLLDGNLRAYDRLLKDELTEHRLDAILSALQGIERELAAINKHGLNLRR